MCYISKYYFFVVVLFAALVGLTASSCGSTDGSSHETLVVGMQTGYPPFDFRDSQGNIVGFDPDVAQQIATKLGKKLVIKDMDFEGLILSLKQGKIDLIMSGMNITSARQKEIFMVPYHGETMTTLSLVFWKKIPEGITTLDDLTKIPSASLSVQLGTVPEEFLMNHYKIPTKAFQDSLAPLMDVKFGKSIATLVETDVAEYFQSQHPEVKILSVPLPLNQKIMGFGIGVNKSNGELYEAVKTAIHALKVSGELPTLELKWFKGVE